MSRSDIVNVYQKEIPAALGASGFVVHPQGSLYHTKTDADPIVSIMTLQNTVKSQAPKFCQYVRRVHVFRMEEWSDVTSLLRASVITLATVDPEEEAEQNELATSKAN